MGKYMRKAKISGEAEVMEVSHQSSLGVRTRARALAAAAAATTNDSSLAYLELRSRRLEKILPLPLVAANQNHKEAPGSKPKRSSRTSSVLAGSINMGRCSTEDEESAHDLEVSFGENILEADERESYVRETTPCNLIRNSESIRTPSSTTKHSKSGSSISRMHYALRQDIPTTFEMEEFFASSEQLQQRIFIEKYNFDPVNDCPLAGRYEWTRNDY